MTALDPLSAADAAEAADWNQTARACVDALVGSTPSERVALAEASRALHIAEAVLRFVAIVDTPEPADVLRIVEQHR